jgi:LysM repeat protein
MDTTRSRTHPPEPRILYGRIAVYAASLLLAFVVGTIVGGGSPDEGELAEAQSEVAELRRANYDLEQQVAAYAAGQVLPPGTDPAAAALEDGEPSADPDGVDTAEVNPAQPADDAAPATALPPGASTYEVQAGDTLTSIAERVYGDGTKFDLIAAANGVDAQLEIGQELVIPPAPEEAEPEAEVEVDGQDSAPQDADAG